MKIKSVEPLETYLEGRGIFNLVFAKVTTDEGIVGYGEGSDPPTHPAIVNAIQDLAKVVVGENPFNIEYLWQKMYVTRYTRGGSEHCAMAAIETALWDIVGKATGQPVYNLIGGKVRNKIKLYSHIDPDRSNPNASQEEVDESLRRRAEEIVGAGFTMGKTHPYLGPKYASSVNRTIDTPNVKETVRRMKIIREVVGEDFDLGIDCHNRFDLPSAVRLCKALEPFDMRWVEDPIEQEEGAESYGRLKEATRLPIATGENLYTIWAFKDLLVRNGVDVILPDLAHTGLSQARKIAAIAESYHIPVMPHNPNGPLDTIIAAHACASIPNFQALEFVYPDSPVRDRLISEPLKVKDGYLELPTKPGWGVEIVEDELPKHPYQEHRNREFTESLS